MGIEEYCYVCTECQGETYSDRIDLENCMYCNHPLGLPVEMLQEPANFGFPPRVRRVQSKLASILNEGD